MSGVIQDVAWQETADELYARFTAEPDVAVRKRVQALWLVRRGHSATSAAETAGVGRRTLTRWLDWYRTGGLRAVLTRVPGHGAQGRTGRLSTDQLATLRAHCASGQVHTYDEARRWVEQQWGVTYSYQGIYAVLVRLGVHPKVPRPAAEKADPAAQTAWKKGG
jgi:transposase